ncbi:MAG TPA: YtxH domain-containing protein [Euzebyales bacterium]|nr:YtxH domain-containing protein [Euzebyales bacterium]
MREQRPVDAGDVVDVGPTPVMRALIGLTVGLAVGAVIALLIPRRSARRL